MTRQSTIFGGGGGANNSFPSMQAGDAFARMGNADPDICKQKSNLPGFVGDGDYITCPIAKGGAFEYYDAGGSLQWSVSVGDAGASNQWTGVHAEGGLLYLASCNTNAAGAMQLVTVDVAGNIVSLGPNMSATYTTNFPDWNLQSSSLGSSTIYVDTVNTILHVVYIDLANKPSKGSWNYVTGAVIEDFFDIAIYGVPYTQIITSDGIMVANGTTTWSMMDIFEGAGLPKHRGSVSINSNSGAYSHIPKGWGPITTSDKNVFVEDGYWQVNASQSQSSASNRYMVQEGTDAALKEIYNEIFGADL